jgi:tetratricopeptide (TPR) repeat protein
MPPEWQFALTLFLGTASLSCVTFALGHQFLSSCPRFVRDPASEDLSLGLELVEYHDFNTAIKCFTRAIEPTPDRADAWFHRAVAWGRKEKYERAEADLTQAIEFAPDHAGSYQLRGNARFEQKHYDLALADYLRAAELDTTDTTSLEKAAWIQMEFQQYEDAIWTTTRALGRNPAAATARQIRGQAALHLERYNDAITDFSLALDLHPNWLEPLTLRGYCWTRVAKPVWAIEDLNRVITARPDDPEAHLYRGYAFFDQKEYEAAVADCTVAERSIGFRIQALRLRASAHLHLGHPEDALADLAACLDFDPDHVDTRINRGRAWYDLQEYERALIDFDHAVAINPNRAEAFIGRGLTLVELGHFDEALANYNRALELHPNDPTGFASRAHCRLLIGDLRGAVADFERVIELHPTSDYALNALAEILATHPDDTIRNGPRAAELARRALAMKECGGYRATLAVALAEIGDFAAAVTEAELGLRQEECEEGREQWERNLADFRAGRPVRSQVWDGAMR